MELDVTNIINAHLEGDAYAGNCSGSVSELGSNAGSITWGNSCDLSEELKVCYTEEQAEEIRDHLREYGAWTDTEIASWDYTELGSFVVQEVMAEVRRLEESEDIDLEDFTIEELQAATENEGGRIYGTPPSGSVKGEWFFYLGC